MVIECWAQNQSSFFIIRIKFTIRKILTKREFFLTIHQLVLTGTLKTDNFYTDMILIRKVLIIGAKGNLGQELAKIFNSDQKYQTNGWDRKEINITNQKQVSEKITKLTPQIIINAAAYNVVDKCEEPAEFEIAKKINGDAVGFLAEVSKKIGAIFVHYSTDYVFNGSKKEGYKEGDQPNPLSRYAESKYLGEKQLQENASEYYLI